MSMTAEQCRMRALECLDLARQSQPADREQLFKMAEAWRQMALAAPPPQQPPAPAPKSDKPGSADAR